MKAIFLIFLFIGNTALSQSIQLSGYVFDAESKESLPSVNIILLEDSTGTSTNQYGYFSIRAIAGQKVRLLISAIGYGQKQIVATCEESDCHVDIYLEPSDVLLDDVLIKSSFINLSVQELAKEVIPLKAILNMPGLVGEKDLLKTIQLLPGVQQAHEGSANYYVRGGGIDQNQILLDGATVYNANHIFGFVSAFNVDAIKSAEFWKSAIPARFGGRISSVLDIQMKEGNKEKLTGKGGIGILSSHFLLEGPIKKKHSSFMISGRRSYIDILASPFMGKGLDTSYRFYDLNLKYNTSLNSKNKLYISGYISGDDLILKEKVKKTDYNAFLKNTIGWDNRTATLRWNFIPREDIFINTSLIYSAYNFGFEDRYRRTGDEPINEFISINSTLRDYAVNSTLDYFVSNRHFFKAGMALINHGFSPRVITTESDNLATELGSSFTYTPELALFVDDEITLMNGVMINTGLRLTGLAAEQSKYIRLEPRINIGYTIQPTLKINASYIRTNQYIHLLSNTGLGLTSDLWVPVSDQLPPQSGDQWGIELTKFFDGPKLTLSVESYHKKMKNIVAYTEGASFLILEDGILDKDWEQNVAVGKGTAFGHELLIKKEYGKLSGWASYTLSWVVHQFDAINNSKPYYPLQDRRHSATLLGMYEVSEKIKLGATWRYASGSRLTPPMGDYYIRAPTGIRNVGRNAGMQFADERIWYGPGDINNSPLLVSENSFYSGTKGWFKTAPYHRLDISIQFHKEKKRINRYWEIGLFNAYNRKNPFSYVLGYSNSQVVMKKKSLFPILPSFSYNLEFK